MVTAWLIMLLYIYHISFFPLPYFLRSRLILAMFGFVVILLTGRYLTLSKSSIKIILVFCLIMGASVVACLINGTRDMWFFQYAILNMLFLLGAYATIGILFRLVQDFTMTKLLKIIIFTVCIHNLLALLMFLSPSANTAFTAIQNFDENAQSVMESIEKFGSRFLGLGIGSYFTGGIISGYALMLAAYIIRNSKTRSEVFFMTIVYCLILVTGLFIARTVLIGAMLSFLLLFVPYHKNLNADSLKNQFTFILTQLFLLATALIAVIIIIPDFFDNPAVTWAFELFMNFGEGAGASSKSTSDLASMYVFPSELKTWLIGDGLFNVGSSYYMHTDVGYLRQIFYFGIPGTLAFFFAQWLTMKQVLKHRTNQENDLFVFLLYTSFIYCLILNLKGLADINFFLFLMLVYLLARKRRDSSSTAVIPA